MLVESNTTGTMVAHRRGGKKQKVASYRANRFNRNIATSIWTEDGELLRMSSRVPVDSLLFVLNRSYADTQVLLRYGLQANVETDGRIHIGPDTLQSLYDLRLPYQAKGSPGFLSSKDRPLETRAAAKMVGLLEQATTRQIVPDSFPLVPEVFFGFDHIQPMCISPSLITQTRLHHGIAPGDTPTREQMYATWETLHERCVGYGKVQFLYPARFIVPSEKLTYTVHPRNGEPVPEIAAERENSKFRDWIYRDAKWIPAIPSGASVWLQGRNVTGREYMNPAFRVLREAGIIDMTFEAFSEDLAAQEEANNAYLELPDDKMQIVHDRMLEEVRPGVAFTSFDIISALADPMNSICAREEPIVSVFWTNHFSGRLTGWDLDFEVLPEQMLLDIFGE